MPDLSSQLGYNDYCQRKILEQRSFEHAQLNFMSRVIPSRANGGKYRLRLLTCAAFVKRLTEQRLAL